MKFVPTVLLAACFVVGAAVGVAGAFTQEPIGQGRGSTQNLADPDAGWGRLSPSTDPDSPGGQSPRTTSSPLTFGVTGPDQRYSPSVDRAGVDNTHLFWNNNTRWR